MIEKQSFIYKIVKKCEIKADIYTILDGVIRPVVMWIHGGALIMGHREDISPDQINFYIRAGYALVSIDYRLAPETKLEAIIEDIKDAYKWIREEGSRHFNFNPDRIAVIGLSGGGYLTLMAGFYVNPRPKALISFYGYGDITEDWYSKPDPYYCKQPLVPKEEAYAAVGGPIISEAKNSPTRWRFYLYCRQNGLWPKEVTGHDPNTEPKAFDSFCPIRNITKEYPPTMLLHGDKDTDVSYRQSLMMANKLVHIGVEYKLITINGGLHGFDLIDFKDPLVTNAYKQVMIFLKKHLNH